MGTTREEIRAWYETAEAKKATHMIVACDTFDHEDYPIFILGGEAEARKSYTEHNGPNMQRVMEVYCLAHDKETQLAEHRSHHFTAPVSQQANKQNPASPQKEHTMTDKTSGASETKNPGTAGVEINGGILTRAPKTLNCNCKVPDMAANAIKNGDEWQCSCGQKWRAKIKGSDYQDAENAYWRRIAKRTPKAKESTAPETE